MKHKVVFSLIAASALVLGVGVQGVDAYAGPTCPRGYVCMWNGINGTGTKFSYQQSANHTHQIHSVFFNYQTMGTKFTSEQNGRGNVITRYVPKQRGFRNWDRINWKACRSHWDFRP